MRIALVFAIFATTVGPAKAVRAAEKFDPAAKFESTIRIQEQADDYVLYEVRFPSPARSLFPANQTVWAHLYIPSDRGRPIEPPRPCVLVLPVMAAPNIWIETRFIRALVAKKYAVMWIEMPYQFHRVPARFVRTGEVFLARTPERLAANFRQSVGDARRAISWLQRSGKVDPSRIGIFGVSLGALVGASVLSMDDRLQGGIFVLGGADFAGLLVHSSMTGKFIARLGISEDSLRRAFRGLDPLDYKERNRGKRVLLLNDWSDHVIPRANGLALKAAFPGAGQIWLPFGHYSGMIHLIWAPAYVARQFKWVFNAPGS